MSGAGPMAAEAGKLAPAVPSNPWAVFFVVLPSLSGAAVARLAPARFGVGSAVNQGWRGCAATSEPREHLRVQAPPAFLSGHLGKVLQAGCCCFRGHGADT